MATTGELRAIVQELHLVDVGEAESYLGEETLVEEEAIVVAEEITPMVLDTEAAVLAACIAFMSVMTFSTISLITRALVPMLYVQMSVAKPIFTSALTDRLRASFPSRVIR